MTRSKRFIAGLLSSYAAIGVNIFYTLASVPLALHYLDKEEFGLWALVTQLSGYLMLLEFGMNGSVARSLTDHKDHMENGIYGSILRTSTRVFAIQGLLVVVLGLALAGFAAPLLGLSSRFQQLFAILMAAQAILSGIRLSLSALGSPLWCHQRLDLSNLASSLGLIASFAALWMGFHLGWHVYSLIFATTAGSALGIFLTYLICRRFGFYPPRKHRGRFAPQIFRELLHFGSGLFLMNLGAQLASASQVIVASRLLGVEAAATWSIATKIFGLAQQFVARVMDSSAGGLAEMVARDEGGTLLKRFRDVVVISAVMAVGASAGIALMNGAFVEIWTSGKVTWAPWNNLLLACVLFSSAVTRCHTSLVGITKHIRGMKYVSLLEGFAFVTLALVLGHWLGLTGLLIAALICNLAVTGSYGVARTAGYFEITRTSVMGWIMRPTAILLLTAGLFALIQLPPVNVFPAATRFCSGAVAFSLIIVPTIWFFGISPSLRAEMTSLLAKITDKAKGAVPMA